MTQKLRWGVLSTARIGTESVVAALQSSKNGEVVEIAGRDEAKAAHTANCNATQNAIRKLEETR